jgi:hypothetical protein
MYTPPLTEYIFQVPGHKIRTPPPLHSVNIKGNKEVTEVVGGLLIDGRWFCGKLTELEPWFFGKMFC